jgi:osmoprotectant transport system permease protein
MELLQDSFQYYLQNQDFFWQAAKQHLQLSLSSLGISLLVCVPLGIWTARHASIAQLMINLFNALRVLPSLAILFLVLPYLGIGFLPALAALTALAFPPILINTYVGIRNIDKAVVEAAYGMGMTPAQSLARIELPLAAPAILAGIRIAAVEVISSATLAAFIGGGGLGDFITRGFALFETRIMLVGAIPVALMALASEALLGILQNQLQQVSKVG